MDFKYFDIHSHIYFPDYDTDCEAIIAEMAEKNIGTITIGTGFEASEKAIVYATAHSHMYASVGDHPGDMTETSVFDERLVELAHHEKVVAIGECGLDYFRLTENAEKIKEIQKNIFEKHIDLALTVDKPLMLHIRSSKGTGDAYNDALGILEERWKQSGGKLRGNAHFFAGNMDHLKRFLEIGFTISFNGVITFTHDYDEFVRYTPLSQMMTETDAPFVAPVPYRGKRNSPTYVPEVVKKIAEIKGESEEVVREQMVANAKRYFNIENSLTQ